MKNDLTELILILDASGSMERLTEDTVGGVNSLLAARRDSACLVTTVLFNTRYEVIHDRLPIDEVPPLSEKEYCAYGGTALLDAVGEALAHTAAVHRYIRPEDVPAKTVVVIMTDGKENASRRFGYKEIRKMIAEREERGWEFLFLAANIDAAEAAADIGIAEKRAARWSADPVGTKRAFRALSVCLSTEPGSGKEMDEAFLEAFGEDAMVGKEGKR